MKKIFVCLMFLMLLTGTCYSKGLMRLPTQEELKKYCIPVVLKIDNDIHYFSFFSIKKFNEDGIRLIYGRDRDKEVFYFKDEILNFDEAYGIYQALLNSLGGSL